MEGERLMSFVVIIAITAVIAATLLGIALLISWLISLAVLVVLRAFSPSHPITPEEEID